MNACMARTGTTLQIPECNENTDLDTGMYQVQDRLYHRKYILHFHGKYSYIKKSQRLTVRAATSVPGETAECFSVSERSI
jgi:hypothetical protein